MDWPQLEGDAVVQELDRSSEALRKRARFQLTYVADEYEDEDGDTATGFLLADPPPKGMSKGSGASTELSSGWVLPHAARASSGHPSPECDMGATGSRHSKQSGRSCLNKSLKGTTCGRFRTCRLHEHELSDSGECPSGSCSPLASPLDNSRKRQHEEEISEVVGCTDDLDASAEEFELETVILSDDEMEDAHFTCHWCRESLPMYHLAPSMSCLCLFCIPCVREHVEATLGVSLESSFKRRATQENGETHPMEIVEKDQGSTPSTGKRIEGDYGSLLDPVQWIACPTPSCDGRLDLLDAQSLAREAFKKWEDAVSREFLHQSSAFVNCPGCSIMIEKVASDLPPGVSGVPEIARTAPYVERDKHGTPLSHAALRHKAANRFRCPYCTVDFCGKCMSKPYHEGKTCEEFEVEKTAVRCNFCEGVVRSQNSERVRLVALQSKSVKELRSELEKDEVDIAWCVEKTELVQVQNYSSGVCAAKECRKLLKGSCTRTLDCGHQCGGVRAERSCLPCLEDGCHTKARPGGKMLASGDDLCPICLVEPLRRAPAIMLSCGHVIHLQCGKKKVDEGYPGPAISFGFLNCSECGEIMRHLSLEPHLWKQVVLMDLVKEKALERLRMDGSMKNLRPQSDGDLTALAIKKFQYYMCSKCKAPYFGGVQNCGAGNQQENANANEYNPLELICGGCSAANGHAKCKKGHGKEYIEFKCRYCCSMATYFCFGKTHFCDTCHNQRPDLRKDSVLPKCKGARYCPLRVDHAPNGQECCLGCSMCRLEGQ